MSSLGNSKWIYCEQSGSSLGNSKWIYWEQSGSIILLPLWRCARFNEGPDGIQNMILKSVP